jgi:hypothetical protein
MDFPWLPVQLALSAALAGLCWTVQLAVYPLFERMLAAAGPDVFRPCHAAYTRAMGWIAAPLMLAELALAAAWLWQILSTPAVAATGAGAGFAWLGAALVAGVWTLTFTRLVPLHHRLQSMPSAEDARRLVAGNWPRTLAWTARAGLLVWAVAVGV